MQGDYEEILKRTWDEIPEAQLLPVGSYRLRSKGATLVEAKEDGKNDSVLFFYNAKEPLDDVDTDALAAMGDYDISQNTVFHRVWIESFTDWDDVRKHVAKHGIEVLGSETIEDTFKRMKGSEVIAWLDQGSYTNKAGELVTQNEPTQFVPVED